MNNVHAITPKGDKGAALIVLEDATQVWTPDIEKAKTLKIGEPIPSSWTQKQGEYGPQAFPPREGKGGGGFKGRSPEQFAAEQRSIHASVALQQAIMGVPSREGDFFPDEYATDVLDMASCFYRWLSETSGAAGAPLTPTAPGSSSAPRGAPVTESGGSGAAARTTKAAATAETRATEVQPGDQRSRVGADTSSAEGNSNSGDRLRAPSASTTTAEETSEGGVAEPGGSGPVAPPKGTCPPHSPDETVEAKAGRYPCTTCGAWVRSTAA